MNLSIGILSWKSHVLYDTLDTYQKQRNGLLTLSDDVTIYFQEKTDGDELMAEKYGVKAIGTHENIGIGKALVKLAENAKHDNILLLEHDWQQIEPVDVTKRRLEGGITLLDYGYDCIRYRHRAHPGFPHFSQRYFGNELGYEDPEIKLTGPHLLDCIHWRDHPELVFPDKIGLQEIDGEQFWVASSRWACFTNNPCLYKKSFYIKTVKRYMGAGIDLEGKISYDWARANYNVAHSSGIFKHVDKSKYSQ